MLRELGLCLPCQLCVLPACRRKVRKALETCLGKLVRLEEPTIEHCAASLVPKGNRSWPLLRKAAGAILLLGKTVGDVGKVAGRWFNQALTAGLLTYVAACTNLPVASRLRSNFQSFERER